MEKEFENCDIARHLLSKIYQDNYLDLSVKFSMIDYSNPKDVDLLKTGIEQICEVFNNALKELKNKGLKQCECRLSNGYN